MWGFHRSQTGGSGEGTAAAAAAAPQWPKKVSDLTFVKKLGRGYFGEVFECRRARASAGNKKGEITTFAVKKVPLGILQQHGLTEQMDREIAIMRSLRHPYIVQLFFDFRDATHVYLGMEFASGGGMFDKLSKAGKFPPEDAARYFHEVCSALEYLHGLPNKVIHRDIKPENILIDGEGHAKLADFGWSNVLNNATNRATFCGTPDYLAPEMIRGKGHNECLDMWTMGVLLYEMVIGKSPFGSGSQEKTCRAILKGHLKFPADMDPDAQDLIMSLCKLKPEERLTAAEAKCHPFVAKYLGHPSLMMQEESTQPIESVEARKLRREKEIVEAEMLTVLQAKTAAEGTLLKLTEDMNAAHSELKKEQDLLKEAQQKKELLDLRREEQRLEMEKLQETMQTLAAEATRLESRPSRTGGG